MIRHNRLLVSYSIQLRLSIQLAITIVYRYITNISEIMLIKEYIIIIIQFNIK